MDIEFTRQDGTKLALTPQESWDIAEQADQLFIQNNDLTVERPRIALHKHGIGLDVVVTRHRDFWRSWQDGTWEPRTFDVFDRYIDDTVTYIDIGAWIGPTVLYAAQRAAHAFAFEPDPVAFAELEQNIALNRNRSKIAGLKAFAHAIAPENGRIRMGSQTGAGRSLSSVLQSDSANAWSATAVTLPIFLEREGVSGRLFIKMDIEGFEYRLLPHLTSVFNRYDTTILISFHSEFLRASLRRPDETLYQRLLRRLRFVRAHKNLLRALPFRSFYSLSGESLSLDGEVRTASLTGKFISDLVATNGK